MARNASPEFDLTRISQAIDDASSAAEDVIEALRNRKAPANFQALMHAYSEKFQVVHDALDSLPISDGVLDASLPPDRRRQLSEGIPLLQPGLRRLADLHASITASVQRIRKADRDRLDLLRHAKEIFDKFVRKGGGPRNQLPKFFDREG